MSVLISSQEAKGPWQLLTWKQGIFSERIPQKFDKICSMWMAIVVLVFNQVEKPIVFKIRSKGRLNDKQGLN
jgi:hypothetical protein